MHYRIVSRSALVGMHVTGGNTGNIPFPAGFLTQKVVVSGLTADQINDPRFTYSLSGGSTGNSRTYRFEVVDEGGFVLAAAEGSIPYPSTNSVSSTAFATNFFSGVGSSGVTVTDANFTQAYHAVPIDSYVSSLPRDYLMATDARIRMTLDLQAAEINDGYQYVQILADNAATCDTGNDEGSVPTPQRSSYMACFEHEKGKQNTNFKKYTFPVLSAGNNCGRVNQAWNDPAHDNNEIGNLCQQRFNTNCRADDGRLLLPASISTLGVRFDAKGSGNDDWTAKSVRAYLQAVPAAPSIMGNPVVSAAPVCKGSDVTISLAFSEIVTVVGTPVLSTTWGDLSYVAGSGANVLSFSGPVTASAGTSLTITGLSGTVKGLSGTSFILPGTVPVNRSVDSLPAPPREAATGFYLLSTPAHLRWFADRIASYPQTSAALAADIDFSPSTGSFPAMGGPAGFAGVFDGRGHTISGITIDSPDFSAASPVRYGLFGQIAAQGVVSNLVISDASVSATTPALVGVVCGHNLGTIDHCSVSGGRLSIGPHRANGAGTVLGGVCGSNAGTVRHCVGVQYDVNYFPGAVGTNAGTVENVSFTSAGNAFSGGEVCYALNGGVTDGSQPWFQSLDRITYGYKDDLPVFSGPTVYFHGSEGYVNSFTHRWHSDYNPTPDYSNCIWTVSCTFCDTNDTAITTGTPEVTKPPTCTEPGETTWTYPPPGHGWPLYVLVDVTFLQLGAPAALGHKWDEPAYEWAADGTSCTASASCTREGCGATTNETVATALVPDLSLAATAAFECSRGDTTETVAAVVERVPGDDDTTNCTAIAVHHGQSFTNSVTLRQPVSYIDSDGVERQCRAYTVLQSSNFNQYYGERGAESWYVVSSNITISGLLRFMDTHAHLILCDGAALTVSNAREGDHAIETLYGGLTIYGQSGGTGAISATSPDASVLVAGDFTVNGGVVEARTTGNYDDFYATRTFAINGGVVRGSVLASRGIALNGGVVESSKLSTNNRYDIVLGWTNATDSITAAVYSANSVSVKAGQRFWNGEELVGDGEVDVSKLAGKTLTPAFAIAYDLAGGRVEPANPAFYARESADIVLTNPTRPGYDFAGWTGTGLSDPTNLVVIPHGSVGGRAYTATWKASAAILYVDENGETQDCSIYTVLNSSTIAVTNGTSTMEAWYVVTNDVTIGGGLRFFDSTNHLIVCDGATLTVTNTTSMSAAAIDARAIFIYSQTNGTGTIVAYGSSYGIRSRSGPVIINGGCVTATATNSASRGVAAYRGLAINGGTVNAAAYSHGIFADNGDITIKGGTTVNADGEHSYGIRAADGAITIFGGTIRVFGGSSYGIYANGNVLLGCTDPTDSICSSASYSACHAASGRVKVMPGQALIDDENKVLQCSP